MMPFSYHKNKETEVEKHLHNQKAKQTNESSKEADGLGAMEHGCPPSPEKLRWEDLSSKPTQLS